MEWGTHIGRAHEKWTPCLDPVAVQRSGPRLVYLIRPPPEASLSCDPPTPGEISDRKSDRWMSYLVQSLRHLLHPIHLPRISHPHTSVSIHDSHLIDTNRKSGRVAWSMNQADGSFRVLWVELFHRGLGLGVLVVLNERISWLDTSHGFSGNRVTGTGDLVLNHSVFIFVATCSLICTYEEIEHPSD